MQRLIIPVLFLFSLAIRAQDTLFQHEDVHYVLVKSDTVFRVYGKLGPYKPAERVAIISQRLERLLDEPPF